MAWMLCEAAINAAVAFVVVLFLKRAKGMLVTAPKKCMIKTCAKPRAASLRGLCMSCYGKAKAKVQAGEVTWERLGALGLCENDADPFDDAYSRATEGE